MGYLIINTINRNIGSPAQSYRIMYKRPLDASWTNGYTVTYAQAQPAPLGLLPVRIFIDPTAWGVTDIMVCIVTVCAKPIETVGDPQTILINNNPC